MKKILSLSILFVLMLSTIAFAADAVATSTDWSDTLLKGAMSIALLAASWLAKVMIPIISRKGDAMFDALWEYLAEQAKKIKNERIANRLVQLTGILNKATDELSAIAGKIVVEKNTEGKIVVKNLNELKAEILERVTPQVTNSTKDLASQLGYDIEKEIEAQIKAKAEKVLL